MSSTNLTGKPSVDRPWLQYYPEPLRKITVPECTVSNVFYRIGEHHLVQSGTIQKGIIPNPFKTRRKRNFYKAAAAGKDSVWQAGKR